MPGKVCQRSPHHGFSEDGICKWCDPPLASGGFYVPDAGADWNPPRDYILPRHLAEKFNHWTSGPPTVHLISSEISLPPDFAAKMRAAFNGSGFRGFKGIPPSEHEADEDPK